MTRFVLNVLFAILFLLPAGAGTITQFNDRGAFNTAVGPTTVEGFGDVSRFPITTGILNSETNLAVSFGPAITPGLIQPGVTYSTTVSGSDQVFDFNIDSGGGFTGGVLDSIVHPASGRVLTVTFDGPVNAFGFDTNFLMGSSFSMTIHFAGGGTYSDTISVPNTILLSFFGFKSSAQDIVSVQLNGDYRLGYGFILDNFTFTEPGNEDLSDIPEPSSMALLAPGLLGLIALYRKRRTHA